MSADVVSFPVAAVKPDTSADLDKFHVVVGNMLDAHQEAQTKLDELIRSCETYLVAADPDAQRRAMIDIRWTYWRFQNIGRRIRNEAQRIVTNRVLRDRQRRARALLSAAEARGTTARRLSE